MKKKLSELKEKELWKLREKAISERDELVTALNTNAGRKGKTSEEISAMLAREMTLSQQIEAYSYALLEKQGRLSAL